MWVRWPTILKHRRMKEPKRVTRVGGPRGLTGRNPAVRRQGRLITRLHDLIHDYEQERKR